MKSLKLSFALILLMMINSACGSIKTRKDLKIQGIEIKRDNASSTKTQVQSNPQPTETVVVEKVVEKPVVVATQNEEKAVAQTAPVVVERKSVDPVSMELQMAAEIRRISGELQDLKDVRAEEQRLKQENELKRAEKLQKMEAKLAVYEQSILALEEELRHLKSLKTAKPVQKHNY